MHLKIKYYITLQGILKNGNKIRWISTLKGTVKNELILKVIWNNRRSFDKPGGVGVSKEGDTVTPHHPGVSRSVVVFRKQLVSPFQRFIFCVPFPVHI